MPNSAFTNPTRVHHLEISSDQTWLSTNTLDASGGRFLPSNAATSGDAVTRADGELSVVSVSDVSAVLQFRSGNTYFHWVTSDTSAI